MPRAVVEIVKPDNADEKVAYGSVGRVMLTTLTKETFIPRFPERDQAIHRRPIISTDSTIHVVHSAGGFLCCRHFAL